MSIPPSNRIRRQGSVARRAAGAMLSHFQGAIRLDRRPLGPRYDASTIIAYDATAPADSLTTYTPTSIPGGRAPHFWLDTKRTYGSSLYDQLGTGFTLLRLGPHAPDAAAIIEAAAHRSIPLKVLDVPTPTLTNSMTATWRSFAPISTLLGAAMRPRRMSNRCWRDQSASASDTSR